MEIIFYIIIFTMGTVFGSFATLAIYRIPLKKNITNERSFCPKCNHKLGFFDLIPVWSYIFLGGKCRYCHKKISPSYLFIELLIGLTGLGIFMTISPTIENYSIITLIEFIYQMIFITTIIIIAGIDKNHKKIKKSIIFVGALICFIHIIYLYMINTINEITIYKYVIYFIFILILGLIIAKHGLSKYSYILEILMICIYMNMFVTSEVFLITAILTMITLLASIVIKKKKNRIDKSDILAEKNIELDIPIAFYLCISNIIAVLIQGIQIINP